MPNIEIHGFDGNARVAILAGFDPQEVLHEAPYIEDVVITHVRDFTQDQQLRSRPFIRLVSTPQNYLPDVIERLKKLGVDLEVQMLAEFHEGKKE